MQAVLSKIGAPIALAPRPNLIAYETFGLEFIAPVALDSIRSDQRKCTERFLRYAERQRGAG